MQQILTVLGRRLHVILTLTEYVIQLTIATTSQIQDKKAMLAIIHLTQTHLQ
jgi:hypothetical protein